MLYLIRGLPGSGKTTLARLLLRSLPPLSEHFEADHYFTRDGLGYQFDVSKLGAAHAWCQSETENALAYKQDVIVSNTFTLLSEMRPYVEMAKKHNTPYTVILCQGNFKNVHNVPEETLRKMKNRFQYDLIGLEL